MKEIFPDASEVAYSYDGIGRLESVLDENRNEIRFGWDAFGLATRTTAANQLTDYVKDQYGLLRSVVSSQNGKKDRTIKREYDQHDRVTKIIYGKGEVETFAYDARGRIAKHTRGRKTETYSYDHFGRLAEKCEDGVTTSYAYDAYGQRTKRIMKDNKGEPFSEETRRYDRYGRLVEISSDGKSVKYEYGRNGRVEKQVIDGKTVLFGYTKYGRLQSKTLLSGDTALAELKYWYGVDGKITARLANGVIQHYRYDLKGQLLAVTDADGKETEQYAYDPAGNILEKTVNGKNTTYTYDKANQLVTSTAPDGKVTKYAYDAAGRMVREGAKSYRYGYLDKVLSVKEGKTRITYGYHVDGQLATVTKGKVTEEFTWDGLALVKRGTTSYVNEPHPGGGAPVASSNGGVMFNDILGTTLGVENAGGYASSSMTAFGDTANCQQPTSNFFTGKPHVDGLGHAFLLRNYRADLGKWPTADPLGYPDGWNQMAYCRNGVTDLIDWMGGRIEQTTVEWVETLPDEFVRRYQIGNEIWEHWRVFRSQRCQQTTLWEYEMVSAAEWADKVAAGVAVLASISGGVAIIASNTGTPLGSFTGKVAELVAGGLTLLSALLSLGDEKIEHLTTTTLPPVKGVITYVNDHRFVRYVE